jgi:hypothetical protein
MLRLHPESTNRARRTVRRRTHPLVLSRLWKRLNAAARLGRFLLKNRRQQTTVAVTFAPCSSVSDAGGTRDALSLTFNPNSHAGFEICRLRERIEAHPQRIAVMISNHPLGLPGRERPERPQSGDNGFDRATSTVFPTVRPSRWSSRTLNDSHCLLAAWIIRTGWPARTFSPTSAATTLITPSVGARRTVFSRRR